jgi:hypothetical protein
MLAGAGAVAYHAGKSHEAQTNQASQEANQQGYDQAQAPPPPPPPAGRDMAGELERLKHLLDEGALSPEEYETAKRQVLQGG